MSDQALNVRIRRGTLEDVKGIWRCIDTAVREGWFTFVEPPPLSAVRSSLSPSSIYFVAERDAQIVGWCDVTPIDQEGFRHAGTLGMALLPAFRDRGLGRQLLQVTVQEAHGAGLSRIELQLLASNNRALALYERSGFVLEGRKHLARVLDEVPEDILCMALLLRPQSR